jgi:hypothetical protein
MESFKNIENKAKENLGIEQLSQVISSNEKTLAKEKIETFIKIFNKYKDQNKYVFYLYSKKYDKTNDYTDLLVKKYEN